MTDHYLNKLMGEMEEILLVIRQHWFVLVKAIFIEGILMVFLSALIIVIRIFFYQSDWVLLSLILLLPPFIKMVWDIIVWSSRKYVITSRRVIHVSGVVNKNVVDSSLEKVNDVRMTQSFFGRIFGFGDIEIMTASELGVNKFTFLGNPVRFKTTMLNAKEKMEYDGDGPHAHGMPAQAADPTAQLARLVELRKTGAITEEEFQKLKAKIVNGG